MLGFVLIPLFFTTFRAVSWEKKSPPIVCAVVLDCLSAVENICVDRLKERKHIEAYLGEKY